MSPTPTLKSQTRTVKPLEITVLPGKGAVSTVHAFWGASYVEGTGYELPVGHFFRCRECVTHPPSSYWHRPRRQVTPRRVWYRSSRHRPQDRESPATRRYWPRRAPDRARCPHPSPAMGAKRRPSRSPWQRSGPVPTIVNIPSNVDTTNDRYTQRQDRSPRQLLDIPPDVARIAGRHSWCLPVSAASADSVGVTRSVGGTEETHGCSSGGTGFVRGRRGLWFLSIAVSGREDREIGVFPRAC